MAVQRITQEKPELQLLKNEILGRIEYYNQPDKNYYNQYWVKYAKEAFLKGDFHRAKEWLHHLDWEFSN